MKNIVENKVKKWVEKYRCYLVLTISIFILFLTLGYSKSNTNYKLYVENNEINLSYGIYSKDNEQYIHINDLTSIFGESVYDDKISGKIIITTYDTIKKISKSDENYTLKKDDGIYFNFKKLVYDLGNKLIVSNDKIYVHNNQYVEAIIKKNRTELYDKQTNNIVTLVPKGDSVKVIVKENIQNGKTVDIVVTVGGVSYYGYVLKDNVYYEYETVEKEDVTVKKKVFLVKADQKLLSSTDNNYIDMVAINMYRLSGTNTLARLDYEVNVPSGVKVYATVNNGYISANYDADLITRMLNSESNRESIITSLLEATKNIDGVCVDFVNLKISDKANFTQFIKELAAVLHANNKEVIVNIPSTQYIDVNSVSNVADYVVAQLYTLRTTASKTSGPISSLTYVENTLNEILNKQINSNKLILELPAYSILWTERKGTVINAERYSMKMIDEYLKANNLAASLDIATGQNYINYTKGMTTYKMWLEDEYSMIQKTKLAVKYNLRGVSIYQSGMELKKVYSSISNNLNK